jgi:hypothetical protein
MRWRIFERVVGDLTEEDVSALVEPPEEERISNRSSSSTSGTGAFKVARALVGLLLPPVQEVPDRTSLAVRVPATSGRRQPPAAFPGMSQVRATGHREPGGISSIRG